MKLKISMFVAFLVVSLAFLQFGNTAEAAESNSSLDTLHNKVEHVLMDEESISETQASEAVSAETEDSRLKTDIQESQSEAAFAESAKENPAADAAESSKSAVSNEKVSEQAGEDSEHNKEEVSSEESKDKNELENKSDVTEEQKVTDKNEHVEEAAAPEEPNAPDEKDDKERSNIAGQEKQEKTKPEEQKVNAPSDEKHKTERSVISSSTERNDKDPEVVSDAQIPEEIDEDTQVKISVISDVHVLLEEMIGDNAAFESALNSDRKMFAESQAIFDAALVDVKESNSSILFITGDLTKDGELKGHAYIAEELQKLKAEIEAEGRDFRVFVIPGNHDLNNLNAKDFSEADDAKDHTEAPAVESATPNDFKELYYDSGLMGEDVAYYTDSSHYRAYLKEVQQRFSGQEYAHGNLSYVTRIDMGKNAGTKGLTIIGLDTSKHSADVTESGKNIQETGGVITRPLLDWALENIEAANKRLDSIMLLGHHGIIAHFDGQDSILAEYLIDNWDVKDPGTGKTPAEELADAGLHYVFTGHMHANDVAQLTTEAGNTIFDIETGSTVSYPSPIRTMVLTNLVEDGTQHESLVIDTSTVSNVDFIDPETGKPIEDLKDYGNQLLITPELIQGLTKGIFTSPAFAQLQEQGIGSLIEDYAGKTAGRFVADYLPQLIGTDLESSMEVAGIAKVYYDTSLDQVILNAMGTDLFITAEDLGKVVDNLLAQFQEKYINDTTYLENLIGRAGEVLLNSELGLIGDPSKTFGDLANYLYSGHLEGDENDRINDNEWVNEGREAVRSGQALDNAVQNLVPILTEAIGEMASSLTFDPSVDEILQGGGFLGGIVKSAIAGFIGDNAGGLIGMVDLGSFIEPLLTQLDLSSINDTLIQIVDGMSYEEYAYAHPFDNSFTVIWNKTLPTVEKPEEQEPNEEHPEQEKPEGQEPNEEQPEQDKPEEQDPSEERPEKQQTEEQYPSKEQPKEQLEEKDPSTGASEEQSAGQNPSKDHAGEKQPEARFAGEEPQK
ncbi:metallophosphoesterase [Terribacillus saccharophilus]|uniref:metallophosphoesterase family protein n=1 Tax=Terribacillus saccharophilus TaxID=361277 RepID=UPI0039829FC4